MAMKKNTGSCAAGNCFLCRYCMPEWVPAIELHKQVLTFKKGEVIFKEGEKVKGIYFFFFVNAKVHKY